MAKVPTLVEMLEAGVHFGHRTSKWHPKMKKFLFGSRQGIHIINLEETQKALEEALAFCKQTTARGGVVLFVGTMTNFSVIAQLLKKFRELKRRQEKGELSKYTKLEQLKFSEQIKMLEDKVGGIQDMNRIPDAVFIQDIHKDKTAIAEAVRRGVKVVAICDSNVNPLHVDYPIPANDDAVKSIALIVGLVGQACKQGKDEWEAGRSRLAGALLQSGPRDIKKQ